MDELLDVVDEKDRVISQQKRSLVKAQKLNHRISHVWVFCEEKLLICKRPRTIESHPNQWTSTAGGHVNTNETYAQAATRESLEELGLNLNLKRAFNLRFECLDSSLRFIDLWYAYVEDISSLIFDSKEICDNKLISFEELERWIGKSPQVFNPELLSLYERWKKVMK